MLRRELNLLILAPTICLKEEDMFLSSGSKILRRKLLSRYGVGLVLVVSMIACSGPVSTGGALGEIEQAWRRQNNTSLSIEQCSYQLVLPNPVDPSDYQIALRVVSQVESNLNQAETLRYSYGDSVYIILRHGCSATRETIGRVNRGLDTDLTAKGFSASSVSREQLAVAMRFRARIMR